MHRPRRLPVRRAPIPNTWTAIVILGALTTFSLTFGSGMAAPRRSQEAAAITNPTVGQPTAERQPWLKYEPALAGKVLHWVETSYSTVPNSPDPANGRAVTADIWELIGQDGTPLLFHGQYTIAGVFHQEVVETPARLDITYGRDYDHIALGKALPCTVSARPSAGDGMRGLLPPFADAAVLARISVSSGQGIPRHSKSFTAADITASSEPPPGDLQCGWLGPLVGTAPAWSPTLPFLHRPAGAWARWARARCAGAVDRCGWARGKPVVDRIRRIGSVFS